MVRGLFPRAVASMETPWKTKEGRDMRNFFRKHFGGYRPQNYSVLRHLAGM